MTQQFTASEVRTESCKQGQLHRQPASDMLNAFADMLEALEKAVPVVTRESAINALAHVGQHNGPGRETEARQMLVEGSPSATHYAQAQPPAARMLDIDTMVTRFLGWRLPQDFAPDAGISFKPMPDEYMPHCWPTGTNLFHAGQAKEMILHILAAQENPNG